jgi:hypothetical protein
MSLDEASQKCEDWRRDYNEERPRSAIGNKPPVTLMKRSAAQGAPLIVYPWDRLAAHDPEKGSNSTPEQSLLINEGKLGSRSTFLNEKSTFAHETRHSTEANSA